MLDLVPFFTANNLIGYMNELEQLSNAVKYPNPTYPPYDIVKGSSEDETKIVVAVAGFKKSEIMVTLKDRQLVIVGEKSTDDKLQYSHKGIAKRNWNLQFTLGKYVEIIGASMEDGMLTVSLERKVPPEDLPKEITIS